MTDVTTEVSEMLRQLTERFVPTIERELSAMLNGLCPVKVEHVPSQSSAHMTMFNLTIKVESMDLETLSSLASHLVKFYTVDGSETKYAKRLSDGRLASLGDGDDAGAAWFEAGKFRIWLRVWAKGHDYG